MSDDKPSSDNDEPNVNSAPEVCGEITEHGLVIRLALRSAGSQDEFQTFGAIVDTGCSDPVALRPDVAKDIGFQPKNEVTLTNMDGSGSTTKGYVEIVVGNTPFPGKVVACVANGIRVPCLIGRELLAHTQLLYDGKAKKGCLILEFPNPDLGEDAEGSGNPASES